MSDVERRGQNGGAMELPVEVREASKKPRRLQVVTTRGIDKKGKPFAMMVAAPGYAISRIIFTDFDERTKRCKHAVITERRRGRPANVQRRENGASEDA